MQISSQTDNYIYRKSVATKKSIILKKISLKFPNPNSTYFCKITFINANPLKFTGKKGHSRTSKSDNMIMIICFLIFQETKTVSIKLVPETVHYISFSSNFIWNHLYLVIILLFI